MQRPAKRHRDFRSAISSSKASLAWQAASNLEGMVHGTSKQESLGKHRQPLPQLQPRNCSRWEAASALLNWISCSSSVLRVCMATKLASPDPADHARVRHGASTASCGTTSTKGYIGLHAAVCGASHKETTTQFLCWVTLASLSPGPTW